MHKRILIPGPVTGNIISSLIETLQNETVSGGHSIFLGQVRADTKSGKTVKAIEYSAYEPMVKSVAEKILKSIYSEFSDVHKVYIIHSTGRVNAGGISLLVLVSAGHRQQAITACSRIVEMIKESLPVWKKEIFIDDTHEWIGNNSA